MIVKPSKTRDEGSFAYQHIHDFCQNGIITNLDDGKQIQPSSIDISLSDEAYEIPGIVRPKRGETVRDLVMALGQRVDVCDFKKSKTYMVLQKEHFDLPNNIYGYCNPKSSTGRVDIHARILTDSNQSYDGLECGYEGEVWISLISNSFNCYLNQDISFSQVRLFNQDTRLRDFEFEMINQSESLINDSHRQEPIRGNLINPDGSVTLSIDLADPVGYEAIETDEVLDLTTRDNDPHKFFKKIESQNGYLKLQKGKFYILSTYESIKVPPYLCAEVVAMEERYGDYRSHYAGFIDPGWGCSNGDIGNSITLEVRPFEDVILRHRDPICRVKYERMIDIPSVLYGDNSSNNYSIQRGPRLSKVFREW